MSCGCVGGGDRWREVVNVTPVTLDGEIPPARLAPVTRGCQLV